MQGHQAKGRCVFSDTESESESEAGVERADVAEACCGERTAEDTKAEAVVRNGDPANEADADECDSDAEEDGEPADEVM